MNRPVVGMAVAAALLSLIATASIASEGLKPSKSKPASVKSKTAEAHNLKRDKLRYRMKQFGMKDEEPQSRVGHG